MVKKCCNNCKYLKKEIYMSKYGTIATKYNSCLHKKVDNDSFSDFFVYCMSISCPYYKPKNILYRIHTILYYYLYVIWARIKGYKIIKEVKNE